MYCKVEKDFFKIKNKKNSWKKDEKTIEWKEEKVCHPVRLNTDTCV